MAPAYECGLPVSHIIYTLIFGYRKISFRKFGGPALAQC